MAESPAGATLTVALLRRLGRFTLDLDVQSRGRRVALFGPSGSGKSTILSAIAGVIKPDAGRIEVAGRVYLDTKDRIHVSSHERRVGMVSQDPLLFPLLTVEENLNYGRRRARGRVDFDAMVDRLELRPLLGSRPHQLSGGEQRRVALGRALLSEPEVLLCDEPFTGLDHRLRRQLVALLGELVDLIDVPLVLVTHIVDEVMALADDVIVLHDGRVEAQGPPEALLGMLFGLVPAQGLAPNFWCGTVTRAGTEATLASVDIHGHDVHVMGSLDIGQRVRLVVPPEAVGLALVARTQASPRNQLTGRVAALRRLNGGILVELDAGFQVTSHITQEASADLGLELGKELIAFVKASAIEVMRG